jgi:hypothetical protein
MSRLKSLIVFSFVVTLAGSAFAGQFRNKKSGDEWQIVTGTVTSIVESERLLMLAQDDGSVSNHAITEHTHVEKPQTNREIEISEVLTGDRVTLYVNPDNNVIARIIYPMDVAVATMTTSTQTVGIVPSTPTASSGDLEATAINGPIVGTLVTIDNNYMTILKRDGGAATFSITDQVAIEGNETNLADLKTNTRVKVWSDGNGNATRVSTRPSDVDNYF